MKMIWKPDWSSAPHDTIGASFNADGSAWWWSVKPEIRGSEKRPNDLKFRGPVYGEGYTDMDYRVPNTIRDFWKDSWVDAPKRSK